LNATRKNYSHSTLKVCFFTVIGEPDPQSLVNTVKTHNYASLQNEIAGQARNDGKIKCNDGI